MRPADEMESRHRARNDPVTAGAKAEGSELGGSMVGDTAGRVAVTDLPEDVLVVFREFRTAEMSTLGREGLPLAWPMFPFFRPDRGVFQVTTSIGLPQKAFNVRRNPRVAMLFSDPTGSGLLHPPAVLVQGDATCPDVIHTDVRGSRRT